MNQSDVINTRGGSKLTISFYGHASLGFEFEGRFIYIDPVGMFHDYSGAPKADVILVTHQHEDHLDPAVIAMLSAENTLLISTETVVAALGKGESMNNGDTKRVGDWMHIEAIPAYNGPERQQFHPHTGRDNGYLITVGGTRIYVAGDGEPTPEMKALRDIDIAFLPVNQPYTMTVPQAIEAVTGINPRIFYPYHYGQTGRTTDMESLVKGLEGTGIEVRIRPME